MLVALERHLHPHGTRKTARDGKLCRWPSQAPPVPGGALVAPDLLLVPTISGSAGESGIPQSRERFNSVLSKLSLADPLGEPVCILVFRIDNRAALIEQFGEEIAVMIDARFAKLLMSKVGPHDQVRPLPRRPPRHRLARRRSQAGRAFRQSRSAAAWLPGRSRFAPEGQTDGQRRRRQYVRRQGIERHGAVHPGRSAPEPGARLRRQHGGHRVQVDCPMHCRDKQTAKLGRSAGQAAGERDPPESQGPSA